MLCWGLNRYYPPIGGPAEAEDERGDWVRENIERESRVLASVPTGFSCIFDLMPLAAAAVAHRCSSRSEPAAPTSLRLHNQSAALKKTHTQIPEELLCPKTQHRKILLTSVCQDNKIISLSLFLFLLFTMKE